MPRGDRERIRQQEQVEALVAEIADLTKQVEQLQRELAGYQRVFELLERLVKGLS